MPTVTATRDSSQWTLRIQGDLLSTNAKEVRDAVSDLLAQPEQFRSLKSLLLDVSSARMIDSVGLNLIVAILRAVKQAGAEMKIRQGDPNVQRILLFTRLDQQVEILKAA
jgi:anti-anti-sigma factor